MKQRTLLREASIHGKSLHTGQEVKLTIKPAAVDSGYTFKRIDLYGKPEIKPTLDLVTDLVRSTDISTGYTKIHTIEHVLSALHGCGIDNAVIEMDSSEPPILDGSAKGFVEMIKEAEPVEQDKERKFITLETPISITEDTRSMVALPYDGLKITCTSADDRGIHTQHLSIEIDPETYMNDIASARTFTIYEDIEELLKLGKIRGGSLDSAIVIKGDQIMSKEGLRFKDEFVRHKILDIIGDIVLLGLPLKAHIVAVRPGHALNYKLSKEIFEATLGSKKSPKKSAKKDLKIVAPEETSLDIKRILDILPHNYPFLLIDRVLDINENLELTALKNVTYNEPYFQGHFPGLPVMPGVLQIEAMAQAAGVLMLRQISSEGKVAFFMSCNKVKFRQAVTPGDQLIISVKLTKVRGNKLAVAEADCKVNDKVVSSAELMFTLLDAAENS